MFQVVATITTTYNGWTITRQIPVFYLQGLRSVEEAKAIAFDVLNTFQRPEVEVNLDVIKV